MSIKTPLMNVMTAAVLKAARGLTRDFGEVANLQISSKGAAGLVTAADLRAEKTLVQELKKARPGFGFQCEEAGEIPGTDASQRWIIDPLDGTYNFIHAIPYFCTSLALEKTHVNGHKEIIAAVIYDPIHNELFCAEKGYGAFVNDVRLQVSQRKNPPEIMLSTGAPRLGRAEHAQMLKQIDAVAGLGTSIRFCGAAALDLAYVAAGRYDGFWHCNLKSWDIAAGILLIQEAGGVITGLDGEPCVWEQGHILAAPPQLHGKLATLLKPVV